MTRTLPSRYVCVRDPASCTHVGLKLINFDRHVQGLCNVWCKILFYPEMWGYYCGTKSVHMAALVFF